MEMKMQKKFLILALTTTLLSLPLPAYAENEPEVNKITVSGEGKASVAPDMALLSLSVVRQRKTAREALNENSKAMNDVLSAMKEFGINEKDLQTSGFSIQPNYVYPNADEDENFPPKIVSYTVANTLGVRVRDLTRVGDVLDKSVTLGVNEGGNVTFIKDDATPTIEEARKKAVENAIAKAKTLTASAGVGIGKILEISEQSYQASPMPMMRAEMAMVKSSADSAPVPIASGENSYNVSVNMQFEIKQ
jgi:uncharacterized protein